MIVETIQDCSDQINQISKEQHIMAKRTKLNNVLIIALVLLGVMAMVILVGIFLPKPREVLQGQAETSDYRISSKVPSRVKELRVKSGDRVKAGDTLVIMDSPEVEAKMMQAEAAEAAAKAIEEKARNGARQQEIQGPVTPQVGFPVRAVPGNIPAQGRLLHLTQTASSFLYGFRGIPALPMCKKYEIPTKSCNAILYAKYLLFHADFA